MKVYPDVLVICDESEVVAEHPRLHGALNESVLDPLHYLSCLAVLPALIEYGKPFVGWKLPEEFSRYQEVLKMTYDTEKARREYIRVLLELQSHSLEEVKSAIHQAMRVGCCQPEAVIGIIRMNECRSVIITKDLFEEPTWQQIKVIQPDCRVFNELICALKEEEVV